MCVVVRNGGESEVILAEEVVGRSVGRFVLIALLALFLAFARREATPSEKVGAPSRSESRGGTG